MLVGTVIPLLEIFDRWDTPGLSNDTEYAVYAFVFAICLVLLVCKLVASDMLEFQVISWQLLLADDGAKPIESGHTSLFNIPPLLVLPLRI